MPVVLQVDLAEWRKRIGQYGQRFEKRARDPVDEVYGQIVAAGQQHLYTDGLYLRMVPVDSGGDGC